MGPARFHCATLLRVSSRSFFTAPISKSSQMPVRAKRESWNDRNEGNVVIVTYCCPGIALVYGRFKPLSTLPLNNNYYKTVIHVSSTIPIQQVTATLSVLAFRQV